MICLIPLAHPNQGKNMGYHNYLLKKQFVFAENFREQIWLQILVSDSVAKLGGNKDSKRVDREEENKGKVEVKDGSRRKTEDSVKEGPRWAVFGGTA